MRLIVPATCVALSLACSAQETAGIDGHTAFPDKETEQLFHEGEKAYNSGSYVQAIDLFTQVLTRDPENLNAFLQRGFCNSLTGAYEAAVGDFTSVIQRRPDHVSAYISRGSAYNRWQHYDLALADLDTAINLDPKSEEAFNNRGWTKKSLNDLAGACKDWKTSRKMGNDEAKIILTNNRCK